MIMLIVMYSLAGIAVTALKDTSSWRAVMETFFLAPYERFFTSGQQARFKAAA